METSTQQLDQIHTETDQTVAQDEVNAGDEIQTEKRVDIYDRITTQLAEIQQHLERLDYDDDDNDDGYRLSETEVDHVKKQLNMAVANIVYLYSKLPHSMGYTLSEIVKKGGGGIV